MTQLRYNSIIIRGNTVDSRARSFQLHSFFLQKDHSFRCNYSEYQSGEIILKLV